ncbi:MAG: GNAT family N-acetyltransferase [Gammaproteobacteria bacterium]|nr:GNAT family N-acetyltransferase [Gammaproteobacteria bacterium]
MSDVHQRSTHKLSCGMGQSIAELHRQAFDEAAYWYTIYSAAKVGVLLDSMLDDSDHSFFGILTGDKLVAYAHVCRLPEGPHLNYIAVHPEQQGKGLGLALLQRVFEHAQVNDVKNLTLHVSKTNSAARRWYAREGFEERSRTSVYLAEPSQTESNSAKQVSCTWTPEQRARMRRFGISAFQLSVDESLFEVGVIGDSLYRLVDTGNQSVVDALAQIEAHRKVVIIDSAGRRPDATVVQIDELLYLVCRL